METIGIIGAGASGVFAAINAKNEYNEVILIDKNDRIGKKIFITGKGRCNITNAKLYDDFLENIVVNKKFMYSSFTKFDNYSLMTYIENKGLELTIQRGERVFPKSEKSNDVIKLFEKLIKEKKVDLRLNENVLDISKSDKFYVRTDKKIYHFDKLVIATGGLSYPLTGSTGDGYKFAKNFSHKLINVRPGLCPILFKDKDLSSLNGISLKNVSLNIVTEDEVFKEFGDMLFAFKFITGPIVLTLSSLINRKKVIDMYIDLKPALDFEKLDNRLIREIKKESNKDISNILKKLLLNSFVDIILSRTNIRKYTKANQLTRDERHSLVKAIKFFDLKYKDLANIKTAIVTSGGVDCKEIDPKTMQSKIVEGLYFIGEILDVDCLTGGFNLQVAFSQAYACAEDLRRKHE